MKFSDSLKKNEDFQFVYQNGKSVGCRIMVLYVMRTDRDTNRVGISVSKKVGNSVVRHHLTRLVRESYRLNEEKFDRGLDLIVVMRPGAKESNFFEVERALLYLSEKQHIVRNEDEEK